MHIKAQSIVVKQERNFIQILNNKNNKNLNNIQKIKYLNMNKELIFKTVKYCSIACNLFCKHV